MAGLSAHLVITGGQIITVNPQDEVAEAVAVRDGRIVGVGTAGKIASFMGDSTEVIRLNGQTGIAPKSSG